MKPERLPIPETQVFSMYKFFVKLQDEFLTMPKSEYDPEVHAKVVRIRKAASEANYHLEAGTREG